MNPLQTSRPLTVVVGAGGVGKTTVAAALGVGAARDGHDALVMTFDPSLRLKDALGVDDRALDGEVRVRTGFPGELWAGLLDARGTFDRLVARHAPDDEARERILRNRFYDHLAGSLAGILEYMAVERLYEIDREGRHERVVLDTPPTRQALDFLEAPQRIVSFLDSGALRVAQREWFDEDGRLKPTSRLGPLGRAVEGWLDRVVGLELLREMAEFFQAFAPLYAGFRERALAVQELLRSPRTEFVLVCGPGEARVADAMFFARKLREAGHDLGRVLVNRVHPPVSGPPPDPAAEPTAARAWTLLDWMARRDARGLAQLRGLLGDVPLTALPLLPREPTTLETLGDLGEKGGHSDLT